MCGYTSVPEDGRTCECRETQKTHVRLSIVLQLLVDFVPRPQQGLCPGPRWGASVPQTSYAHPTSKPNHGYATARDSGILFHALGQSTE